MAIKAKTGSWQVVLLLVLATGLWVLEQWNPGLLQSWHGRAVGPPVGTTSRGEGEPARVGGYERIDGCRWVDHRQNDGDSFRLELPDGRVVQFRLYFVDTPESAFRRYGGGRDNHDRIRDQARDMGVTDQQAVEIGKEAKQRVEAMLRGRDVTVFTAWDDPFGDQRFHAFVLTPDGGWLHEWLVVKGLARVHTKGAMLPDGTKQGDHKSKLKDLEKAATR